MTYSNEAKTALAGVEPGTLAAHGAVSEATVAAMARGGLERAGADVAIAVSGIAGPGGAVPGKPVGTVWLALALGPRATGDAGGAPVVRAVLHRFHGNRAGVRRAAVVEGLRATLSTLRPG